MFHSADSTYRCIVWSSADSKSSILVRISVSLYCILTYSLVDNFKNVTVLQSIFLLYILASVLWCCWLGAGRASGLWKRAVVTGVAMCRFAYSPDDASWTTRVSRYQKKHSPTHPTMVIKCPLSASSICKDPWHTPCSIHILDSLFHCLSPRFLWSTSWPDTLHFILQFFVQSLSSFCIHLMCIYLFCCSTEIMSFNPRLFQPFTWHSVVASCHIFI